MFLLDKYTYLHGIIFSIVAHKDVMAKYKVSSNHDVYQYQRFHRLLPTVQTNNNITCERTRKSLMHKGNVIHNLRAVMIQFILFSFHWTDRSTQLCTYLETTIKLNHILRREKKS
jgi:hypothetical protein